MAAHCQRIADFGTPARCDKELAPFEPLLAGKYQAFAGPGGEPLAVRGAVDGVADLQKLDFPDGHFDGVICLSVLEHVPRIWTAAREIARVTRRGGRLLATIPWMHPFHESGAAAGPDYNDYWRVSKRGAAVLFEDYSSLEIVEYDGWATAAAKLTPRWLPALAHTSLGRRLLNGLDRRHRENTSLLLVLGIR